MAIGIALEHGPVNDGHACRLRGLRLPGHSYKEKAGGELFFERTTRSKDVPPIATATRQLPIAARGEREILTASGSTIAGRMVR